MGCSKDELTRGNTIIQGARLNLTGFFSWLGLRRVNVKIWPDLIQRDGGGDVAGAEGKAPGRRAPGEILLHLTAFPFPHL